MTPSEKEHIRNRLSTIDEKKIRIQLQKNSQEQSSVLERFIDTFAEVAPSVKIKKETDDDHESLPAIVVGDRLRWHAVPLEKELEPFLYALTLSAAADDFSDTPVAEMKNRLADLALAASFEIFIAPLCPFCPVTVSKLIPLAFANDLVRVSVIDAALFPDPAGSRKVRSVPMAFLDDAFSWTGVVDSDEIIHVMKNRDPSQLSSDSLKNMLHEGMAWKVAEMMADKKVIFPAFTELLFHPKWTVRLGAMAAMEELAARNMKIAGEIEKTVWEKFRRLPDPVKGDAIYVLGETGNENTAAALSSLLKSPLDKEVKEAALDAIETIRKRRHSE